MSKYVSVRELKKHHCQNTKYKMDDTISSGASVYESVASEIAKGSPTSSLHSDQNVLQIVTEMETPSTQSSFTPSIDESVSRKAEVCQQFNRRQSFVSATTNGSHYIKKKSKSSSTSSSSTKTLNDKVIPNECDTSTTQDNGELDDNDSNTTTTETIQTSETTTKHTVRYRKNCCSCSKSKVRCAKTTQCPCIRSGRLCLQNCETAICAKDCCNTPLTQCNCPPDHKSCDTVLCECRRFGESCTQFCACKTLCTESSKNKQMVTKVGRPVEGCRCKKTCSKWDKCICRQSLQHCTEKCKCCSHGSNCQCTNTKETPIGERTRECFINVPYIAPTKTPTKEVYTPRAAVVVLVGADNYSYRFDVCDSGKEKQMIISSPRQHQHSGDGSRRQHVTQLLVGILHTAAQRYTLPDIHHIFVYMSRSPCYHQHCVPPCERLQECTQYECARLMAIAYGQLRRTMLNVHLAMTVKFLSADTRRGDLYTQQGVLHMMRAGITVEPLVMKEWTYLLNNEWKLLPFVDSKSSDSKPLDAKGELGRCAATIAQWSEQHMDRHVHQSQMYINACRHTLGMREVYWTSTLHDLLKSTAIASSLIHERLAVLISKLSTMQTVEEVSAKCDGDELQEQKELMERSALAALNEDTMMTSDTTLWSAQTDNGIWRGSQAHDTGLEHELYLINQTRGRQQKHEMPSSMRPTSAPPPPGGRTQWTLRHRPHIQDEWSHVPVQPPPPPPPPPPTTNWRRQAVRQPQRNVAMTSSYSDYDTSAIGASIYPYDERTEQRSQPTRSVTAFNIVNGNDAASIISIDRTPTPSHTGTLMGASSIIDPRRTQQRHRSTSAIPHGIHKRPTLALNLASADTTQIVLNLSARSISAGERKEIIDAVQTGLNKIEDDVQELMAYLQQTSAAISL